jgi:hypothetical protein
LCVDLVGNRPITSLTRADALRLRSHWQDRVVAGEVQIGTANECIGHVSANAERGSPWAAATSSSGVQISISDAVPVAAAPLVLPISLELSIQLRNGGGRSHPAWVIKDADPCADADGITLVL